MHYLRDLWRLLNVAENNGDIIFGTSLEASDIDGSTQKVESRRSRARIAVNVRGGAFIPGARGYYPSRMWIGVLHRF